MGAVVTLACVTLSVETTYVDDKPDKILINNTSDFINFAKSVNSGTSYLGTTVLLKSDISFSEKLSQRFEPIGKSSSNYFNGEFDGQGHIISNLRINSALSFTGLFGFSYRLTIKNVVLDDSCSITNSYSDIWFAYVGGIIGGCCLSKNGACIIENSINMASVTFVGDTKSDDLNIGGIVGKLYSSSYPIIIKNCVNYGSVTHSGTSERSYIGGIVGSSWGKSRYNHIKNCVNYGTIAYSGTTKDSLQIGGITGYSRYTYIVNCLSAEKISVSEYWGSKIRHLFSSYKNIGSIVGSADSETNINYCFWTSDVGVDKIYGNGKPSLTGISTLPVSASGAVNELNIKVASNNGDEWNKWLHNPNRRKVSFTVNDNKHFSLSSQIILLPNLAGSNEHPFIGWYTDSGYSKPFGGNEIELNKELYGAYNKKVTVYFDSNGDNIHSESPIEVIFGGTYKKLPKPTRKGYTFAGWFTNENEIVTCKTIVKTANGHTLHAHWTANKYTVTFNPNGGVLLPNQKREVTYDAPYGYFETPTRTGCTFIGWYTDKDERVDPFTTVATAGNHVLYAHWTGNKYIITYDVNGGNKLPSKTKEVTYDAPYGDLETPTRKGYRFSGWYTDVNVTITNKTIVSIASDHKVYAYWTPNKYTVTYDVDGGKALSEKTNTVTYDTPYGNLVEPTRRGYKFIGWYTNNNENITNETIVSIASDHILYTHWKNNQIRVTIYVMMIAIVSLALICTKKPKITIIKLSPMKKALLLLCIVRILNFWGHVHEYPF